MKTWYRIIFLSIIITVLTDLVKSEDSSIQEILYSYKNNNIDSLIKNPQFEKISNKYVTVLGRDNDPKKVNEVGRLSLFFRKMGWELITSPGLPLIIKFVYPKSTVSHFSNVSNAVAFTIDDGFCGLDNSNGCMVEEVRHLLKSYNAHATFFVAGTHCNNVSIDLINNLIMDGNEISNHNMMDWKYDDYSGEDFEFDLVLSNKILENYNQTPTKWYRAPFGALSQTMNEVISKYNLVHSIPDVFAHDTYIPDPKWISNHILRKVKPGSIILIHMPEKGVREWNLNAIDLTLKGLREKGLMIYNLSEMDSLNNN